MVPAPACQVPKYVPTTGETERGVDGAGDDGVQLTRLGGGDGGRRGDRGGWDDRSETRI